MPPDTETAFAKINLALHVRRRREDGYHDIETLFAFAKHGDQLQASLADTLHFTIDGPFGSGLSADDDNLVMQAAKRLRAHFSITEGASIRLTKNLPIASGIGGGSADAAAAARLARSSRSLTAAAARRSASAARCSRRPSTRA